MKTYLSTGLLVAVLSNAVMVTGCVQMPTEKQGLADLRPGIAFNIGDPKLVTARVVVDGLDLGTVGDYLDCKATVRLLNGTHFLRVISGADIVHEEKFYLADGVNRSFILN